MNNKRKLKIIGGLFSVILIIAAIYGTLVYFHVYVNGWQSSNGGGSVKAGEPITFNTHRKYKFVYMSVEVSTYGCKEKIKYYVKSPDNTIMDQGEIEKDGTLKLTKEFPGQKGVWRIEFENLLEGEALSYEHTFFASNKGWKRLRQ